MVKNLFVGLDIGGTKTAVLVADQNHDILSRYKTTTHVDNPASLLAGTITAIETALDRAGKTEKQILAIGAGVPGHVLSEQGVVNMAVNLNISSSYPIGPKLSKHFAVPVAIENDVRTATLGAYQWLLERRPASSMAYISIGTGIASGAILDSRLFRGARGVAGEIGHLCFDPNGPICACGMPGCLEALASGPAIARAYQLRAPALAAQAPTAKEVYQAADAGQTEAVAVIRQTSQILARAAYTLVNMYDVEVVIFGGGVSSAGASFLDPILKAVAEMKEEYSMYRAMLRDVAILSLPPQHSAATWGAIMLAQQLTS